LFGRSGRREDRTPLSSMIIRDNNRRRSGLSAYRTSNPVLTELVLAGALGGLAVVTAIIVGKHLMPHAGENLRELALLPKASIRRVLKMSKATTASRPRVIVAGPKVKPVVCQICLGRVKEGLEYARCTCGKQFHPVCLIRTSFCPYCGRAYDSGVLEEGILVRPRTVPSRRSGDITMLWSPGARSCPSCGATLADGQRECSCGTILVEEGESFTCPSCGTLVPPERIECPGCREKFEIAEEARCPVCGGVREGDEPCECGGIVEDICPECGASLATEDRVCGHCGTMFEFV